MKCFQAITMHYSNYRLTTTVTVDFNTGGVSVFDSQPFETRSATVSSRHANGTIGLLTDH